ncbi:prolyl oligopeptidase family serine peptidase [Pedobacter sp. CFBP9032]|uniref:prolyl oligopeptidase family serine peptidase n=1 Tax=Pedobacter sp. CFBP9032 TaxID=3096539 RepID=UPI002A6B0497|nr:prolyl oligopeptidase family serine peptidase [Pedobacter sp. CFBP9032]MDY0907301.1 prolyl oligopeptidase family serine peptidase [Pedobacter sp. CFBP9032]
MNKKLLLGLFALSLFACNQGKKSAEKITLMKYPETKKDSTTDNYFGKAIADPYRWLENDTSAETKAWVVAQNKVTQNYLSQIPYREDIKKRLTEIWNYPKESAPFKVGEYYFFTKNDGLQNQGVWFIKKGLDGKEETFLDPNKLTADGTAAISLLGFSHDKKYVAYSVAQAGSDWSSIYVMDIATKTKLPDELKWTKFSGAAWKNDGFYYSKFDAPAKGMDLSAANKFQKIYYHKLGDPQQNDQLIFEDKTNPNLYFGASVTEDDRFLIIYASAGTSGNALYYQDLNETNSKISSLVKGYDHNHNVIDNIDGKLLLNTDLGAENKQVVLVDPKNPDAKNWQKIIPESKLPLEGVGSGGGFLWASYLKDASTNIVQFELTGKQIGEVKLPAIGTASGFGGYKNDKEFFYTFTNFTTPGAIYRYDISQAKSELYKKSGLKFNTENYETKQVFYPSKDGTKVPMFIVHKKGIKLDGNNPVYLYAYGGFQISLTPAFSLSRMLFLERGGIYVQPSLRGGSEYGEAWHKGGMLANKQNVFDDFIAAAEYLVKEKYTNPSKIAISGGSNGGLLVGACMTQRPELFKVALPAVGVLDMLRYHKFTVGWGWAVEYGTSDKKEDFNYLIKYSPLHNVKAEVNYPATLITTADHDDRVVPAHSFKFAATLQEKYKGENPMLIRIETKAGHGAGKPTTKMIEEAADIWSFVFQNLGMSW